MLETEGTSVLQVILRKTSHMSNMASNGIYQPDIGYIYMNATLRL